MRSITLQVLGPEGYFCFCYFGFESTVNRLKLVKLVLGGSTFRHRYQYKTIFIRNFQFIHLRFLPQN